ncbi:MAG: CRISPR-associated protein Cas2 [Candidatus Rifleibacterium amylolyticum]|nr:MAG: CRISPR-associated protein Cas2 [Candidatus Rifleibacterium amylolyticum]
MLVLITYDVSTVTPAGRKRLNKVARACKDYGLRAQKSIFECEIDPAQWTALKNKLLGIINEEEDSLRFYYLGSNWERKVEHHGANQPPDMKGLLMI